MELACRQPGDELLKSGELTDIRRRLRRIAPMHDLATVITCAFDRRTRMLPFIFTDMRMAPAGVRAIGSAMVDSGFVKTRIVLQQWNRRFRPSQMRLDGRIPDLFMISSMALHLEPCRDLIRDVYSIEPAQRPLIVVGGALSIYQPYQVFSVDPADPASADVAVTGEEYVLLSLLEVLLSLRAEGNRCDRRSCGHVTAESLDDIPGLVYARGDRDRPVQELVDTGVQRLVGDLDELPDPVLGYRVLEAPGLASTLGRVALSADRIRRLAPISSIVMTFGCRFSCPYCPTPAYNQRQYRFKSGQRIAEEMGRLNKEYGLRYFFATDDNFFNSKERALNIVDALACAGTEGKPLCRRVRWSAEVTVHGTLQMKDHLGLLRRSGCRALWLGVEDMTASLIQKGQSVDGTTEAFNCLREAGVCPMPMLMHHDEQPLYTRNSHYGLLNQVRLLRKAGAASLQVLMMTPAPGSKLYEQTYTTGQVIDSVAGRRVMPYMLDGNYVVASKHLNPWRKQFNVLIGYSYFYNPLWLLMAVLRSRGKLRLKPAGMQVVGMLGLGHTIRRTLGWAIRLRFGRIRRCDCPPASPMPVRSAAGRPVSSSDGGQYPAVTAGQSNA